MQTDTKELILSSLQNNKSEGLITWIELHIGTFAWKEICSLHWSITEQNKDYRRPTIIQKGIYKVNVLHVRLARWSKWKSCDVGEAKEGLENEQSSFSKLSITSPTSQLILILQAFRHFTYVISHSPTLPLLYLHHNSFSNPLVVSPTSQFILQPFFRFFVTGSSLTSPGEPPMYAIW